MKLLLSGWQVYANISKVSDVDLYDYDAINFSYITVKFKSGDIYTYSTANNTVNMIRAMIVFANNGVGLRRYINLNQPNYTKGIITEPPTAANNQLEVKTVQYPLTNSNITSIDYNNGKNWCQIKWKNGDIKTYTADISGKENVLGIIQAAIKGYGLAKFITENKIISVEENV